MAQGRVFRARLIALGLSALVPAVLWGQAVQGQTTEMPPLDVPPVEEPTDPVDARTLLEPSLLRLQAFVDRDTLWALSVAGDGAAFGRGASQGHSRAPLQLATLQLAQSNPRTGPAFSAGSARVPVTIWSRMNLVTQDGNSAGTEFDTDLVGVAAGLERSFGPATTAGISYRFSHMASTFDVPSGGPGPRAQRVREHMLSLYLVTRRGPLYLAGSVGGGWGGVRQDRSAGVGGGPVSAQTSRRRGVVQGLIGGRYRLGPTSAGQGGWQPHWQAGLVATRSRVGGYRDGLGARFDDRTETLVQGSIGGGLDYVMPRSWGQWRPGLRLTYARDLRRSDGFDGDDRNGLNLSAGVDARHRSGWRGALRLDASLVDQEEDRLSLTVGLRRRFAVGL